MNHLKYLLLESVSIDDIYQKYYSDIPRNEFNRIVKVDPTHIEGKRNGKYIQWMLKLYKQGKLKLEDTYKGFELLSLFDKKSVRNKLEKVDIFKYSGFPELAKAVEPFRDSPDIESKTDVYKKTLIKEFKNYTLHEVSTYEDSCILGSGTEWCTATGKTREHYDFYTYGESRLVVLIGKKDKKNKYQLQLTYTEYGDKTIGDFMDKYDSPLQFLTFLKNNPDFGKFISPYVEVLSILPKKIHELDGVEYLQDLRAIDFGYNFIESLKPLSKNIKLKSIYCADCEITSLEGLEKLVNLEELLCFDNKIKSLKPLSDLKNLLKLSCSSNLLTNIHGIENLNIKHLNVQNNPIRTLEGVQTLDNLKRLYYGNEYEGESSDNYFLEIEQGLDAFEVKDYYSNKS